MADIHDDILWQLLGKKLSGQASPEELEELDGLMERSPEALYTLEAIENYWKTSPDKTGLDIRDAALERHLRRINAGNSPRLVPLKRTLFAGAAIAAAVAGWFVFSGIRHAVADRPSTQTIVARKGSKSHFTLPDGSRVWLNAGSSLHYSDQDSLRVATLSGEAYIEVKRDARHPFVIRTPYMDVRDLGTKFNVKAYPTDKTAEATLLEGSIQVVSKNGKNATVLSAPNQKVIVATGMDRGGEPLPAATDSLRTTVAFRNPADSLITETAWVRNILAFHNETFQDLAVRLERWYNVVIKFENPKLEQYRFTGTFAGETLDQALQELQIVRPFHFVRSDSTIFIH